MGRQTRRNHQPGPAVVGDPSAAREPPPARTPARSLSMLACCICDCRLCERLVQWREQVAREKVRRFSEQDYWGRGVPGFGDPAARLLIIGLAPAAHGANRTGRMFTGDSSGLWLYRALYRAGFANQPDSLNRNDGLRLIDCYVAAVIRCAPPKNKPAPSEIMNCRPYLLAEAGLLPRVRVIVALGQIAFDSAIQVFGGSSAGSRVRSGITGTKEDMSAAVISPIRKPRFGHSAECEMPGGLTLIASYHPSQQNTFTGKLTEPMFDSVFLRARAIINGSSRERV